MPFLGRRGAQEMGNEDRNGVPSTSHSGFEKRNLSWVFWLLSWLLSRYSPPYSPSELGEDADIPFSLRDLRAELQGTHLLPPRGELKDRQVSYLNSAQWGQLEKVPGCGSAGEAGPGLQCLHYFPSCSFPFVFGLLCQGCCRAFFLKGKTWFLIFPF